MFCARFFVTLVSPKLLPFGNEIKNFGFCFAFRSLIRNFAPNMNLTSIVGKLFVPRQKELERHFTDGEQLQKQVLNRLLAQGANTEYGRKYDFANIHSYEEFTRLVPQTAYEELAPWIDRMRHGERNVLWPGLVTWFAKSSGTTNDKSKFIPVTREGLKNIHFRGSKDALF